MNKIYNIKTIDPLKQIESMRSLIIENLNALSNDNSVHKAIEDVFDIKIPDIKEIFYKFPDGNLYCILVGSYKDCKKLFDELEANVDKLWLYGPYPVNDIIKCNVIGLVDKSSLDPDRFPIFIEPVNYDEDSCAPWTFYRVKAKLISLIIHSTIIIKSGTVDNIKDLICTRDNLLKELLCYDSNECISTDYICNNLISNYLNNDWAKTVRLIIKNMNPNYKHSEFIDDEYYEDDY